MKPDILICWPRSCDYPLWRQFIHENRDRFRSVIIIFTETYYGEDYREFIRHAMNQDTCTFIDCLPMRGDQDWRNISVNAGLLYSTSDWIWFTEQDFLPTSNQFWIDIDNLSKGFDVFGFDADGRLHPCCIFMKKTLLDQIHKNFGILKDKLDHFGLIQENLEQRKELVGKVNKAFCHHMNGLSQNYSMAFKGESPNFQPDEFRQYLNDCLRVSVPLDERFYKFAKGYLLE